MSKKSISHEEALRQAYAENPSRAVEDVLELARQANELEDRVKALEAENAALKRELKVADRAIIKQHNELKAAMERY